MLIDPWKGLALGEARRVDRGSKFEFFWVILENQAPGMMLTLHHGQTEIGKLPQLKNLDISYRLRGDRQALVLGLHDRSQIEIFETLCRDVYAAGERATSSDAALSNAIQRTGRWHFLLKGGSPKRLSTEEQRGLVGELDFLRQLIGKLGPCGAVEAWRGPLGSAKDFELPEACIEIKARRGAAKPHVQISSEDQLADVANTKIFLRVMDVDTAIKPLGMDLHAHVSETKRLIGNDPVATDIWEATLLATGYEETQTYDDRRWVLGQTVDFRVEEGFPRIVPPLLGGVGRVRYTIALEDCKPFELDIDLLTSITADGNQ